MTDDIDPQAGRVQMHGGCCLYWEKNAAGGRTYHSDEIAGGVLVWDTCLVEFATICEAFSMEIALQGIERRATQRRERARPKTTEERFALLSGADGPAGSTSQAPTVRPADDGPCPNCGALGCWTPCPHEPPLPESIPEGVVVVEGPLPATFAGLLRAAQLSARNEQLTHADVTLRVHLIRARNQLLRYSSEDPMAAEITKLLEGMPKNE